MSFGKFLKKALPAALGIAALVGTGGSVLPALSRFAGSAALKKIGIPALVGLGAGLLTKQENKQDTKQYFSPSDIKNKNIFGGSRFIDDRFRGLKFNQADQKFYDQMDFDNQTFSNFIANDQGEIIDPATGEVIRPEGGELEGMNMGGIAMLDSGGEPNVKGILSSLRDDEGIREIDILMDNFGMSFEEAKEYLESIADNKATGGQPFPRKTGQITGPGGPKDDKVPAMLSNGEFVFTAKAVDNAGGPKAMYNLMNKLDPESSKGRGIMS